MKYLTGADVDEDRPAVVSVNMAASSMAVMEFLGRLHPYRIGDSAESARLDFSFTGMLFAQQDESSFPVNGYEMKNLGRGDTEPLLYMPSLSRDV